MTSIDLSNVKHHPVIAEISQALSERTRNPDLPFFRTIAVYFTSVIASTMRATLLTKDRGEIPVNAYVLALNSTGTGKGYAVGITENEILMGFRMNFTENTLPVLAEINLRKLANKRAAQNNTNEEDVYLGLNKEYQNYGAYPFVFDKASDVAIKDVRNKLLMAGTGSLNLQIDEIGSHLLGATDALNAYLELYDQGMIHAKITKNTNENKRTTEIIGKTPANGLFFGTPSKLLNGAKIEQEFYDFLETGFARRLLFSVGVPVQTSEKESAADVYARLSDPKTKSIVNKWATHFTSLADIAKQDWAVEVPDDVGIELMAYRLDCEKLAKAMPEHATLQKAEMIHRYTKVTKLAGVYAFVDEDSTLSMFQLHSAMKFVEESGEAFQALLSREKAYMKLARYIAGIKTEVTHADLLDALPFYKSTTAQRNELMTLAIAWGSKHHIMIKRTINEFGIELFSGETLQETSLGAMRLSYSTHFAENWSGETVPFSKLSILTQAQGHHWSNHHFHYEHRKEENAIPGFNMVVIDVDDGKTSIKAVQELLKDYTWLLHTTKRSTEKAPRFRLILPTNYHLKLDSDDYKAFMEQVAEWLPFTTDREAQQRSRKWLSNDKGIFIENLGGKLLDVLQFVPKTTKNENYRKEIMSLESLGNLERWFAQRFVSGNRNNNMIKFALALMDSGLSYGEIENRVVEFNKTIPNGLSKDELQSTVLKTVASRISNMP